MSKYFDLLKILLRGQSLLYENKRLYQIVLAEMVALISLMGWFVLTDLFVKDILPPWVSVLCVISFVSFTYGMIAQNQAILKSSVIMATALLAPFVYTLGPDAPNIHRIGALLLPTAVALLIDGWYWVIGSTVISFSVLLVHVGPQWIQTLYVGDYVWFIAVIILLMTTRLMTDLALHDWNARTKALVESNALTEMLSNSVDAGIIVTDANLRVRIWNSRMVAFTGLTADDIDGLTLPQISALATMQPERNDQVSPVMERVLHGETVVVADSIIPFPRTGTNNWYSRSYAPHYDSRNRIIGVVESVRDVTKYHLDAEIIRNLNERLMRAYDTTLLGWVKALDMRDEETEGHSRRVTLWTVRLARRLGIPEAEIEQVRRGALLHDIGKLAIPDAVLQKPGKLDAAELSIMRTHPDRGYDMLRGIEYLSDALDIVHSHHERWDGTGYPKGLRENAIPLAARAFSIIDVFDALTSDRPYRKAMPIEDTLAYIRSQAGTYFDPEIVRVFLESRVWEDSDVLVG